MLTDCHKLAPHLKEQDVIELNAALGANALDGLLISYGASIECKSLTIDGNVVAMGGYSKGALGYICWILTNGQVKEYGNALTELAAKQLEKLKGKFVYNYVADTNQVSQRWLTRLGFKRGGTATLRRIPFTLMYKED